MGIVFNALFFNGLAMTEGFVRAGRSCENGTIRARNPDTVRTGFAGRAVDRAGYRATVGSVCSCVGSSSMRPPPQVQT